MACLGFRAYQSMKAGGDDGCFIRDHVFDRGPGAGHGATNGRARNMQRNAPKPKTERVEMSSGCTVGGPYHALHRRGSFGGVASVRELVGG
jgi:hypothetical protein